MANVCENPTSVGGPGKTSGTDGGALSGDDAGTVGVPGVDTGTDSPEDAGTPACTGSCLGFVFGDGGSFGDPGGLLPPAPAYGASCPNEAPDAGTPCDASVECVYGPHVDPNCDQTFSCGGADPRFGTPNTWSLDTTFAYACEPYDGTCPATFDLVPQGQACSGHNASGGAFCAYPEGLCNCTQGPGGGGPKHAFEWECAPPPVDCPVAPPLEGQACTMEGQQCDYGSCVLGDGSAPVYECSSGVWLPAAPTQSCE